MDLYELLGEDPNEPRNRLARELVAEDAQLIRDLIQARKDAGKSQEDVAKAMGTSQASISRLESGVSDLHQSTIRRYALAVGRIVRHTVEEPSMMTIASDHANAYAWDQAGAGSVRSTSRQHA